MRHIKIKKESIMYLLCIFAATQYYSLFNICAVCAIIVIYRWMIYGKKHDYGRFGGLNIIDYVVVLYTISYIFFGIYISNYEIYRILYNGLIPFFAYFYGKNGFCYIRIETVKKIILSFAIGFCVINFISTIGYSTYDQYMVTIWGAGSLVNPVNLNAYNVIAVSLLFYGLCCERNKHMRLVILTVGIVSIYTSIHTAKRTNLVIAIFIFSVLFILFGKFKDYFRVIVICLGMYIFFCFNDISKWALSIRTSREHLDIGNDIRFTMWKIYLLNMLLYPFSGRKINNPYYVWAHNMFLDVFIQHGIITMFLLIVFFLFHFYHLYCLWKKNSSINLCDKIFFASISIGLFLNEMVSPPYDAFPFLVYFHFFMCGYIEGLNRKNIGECYNEEKEIY